MVRSEQTVSKPEEIPIYKSYVSIIWKVVLLAIILGCLNSSWSFGHNRILVFSSGGARGAWGGGVIQNLVERQHSESMKVMLPNLINS